MHRKGHAYVQRGLTCWFNWALDDGDTVAWCKANGGGLKPYAIFAQDGPPPTGG
jgi:hypothetical protein